MGYTKAIILPIKPIYIEKIFSGEKMFEYRRKMCKLLISKIYIYSTSPIKKVVGEVEVISKLIYEKDKLWKETKDYSGISKDEFEYYFKKAKYASAYELGKAVCYSIPKDLIEFGIKNYPQSYVYINI